MNFNHKARLGNIVRIGLLFLCCLSFSYESFASEPASLAFDERVDAIIQPVAQMLSNAVFFKISALGVEFPIIVLWLAFASVFFTVYFRFLNLTGFVHAFRLLRGDYSDPDHKGEVSHFQALATAVSGTVGIGNIGGVAIVISVGGPGAVFWMIAAGFFSMSTKFAECVAGVKYRRVNADGSVSGGPMYYITQAFKERNLGWLAKLFGGFYAAAIVIGCLGIGNMFQSNQAFEQFVFITGGDDSSFKTYGWLFGILLALLVGIVIVGGIKSIANVTSRLVPFMALAYVLGSLAVILINIDRIPVALSLIIGEAFDPKAVGGGVLGVMILGFQRAVFSNEAGIGSAAVAHSAVKTNDAVTEGYVGLMEPFIDTVVICTLTALVILTTIYTPEMAGADIKGVELTSRAFASAISWSPVPLSLVAVLFAFSTLIAWSYYGLKGWTYLVGESRVAEIFFQLVFCLFAALGCMIQLDSVLAFSDALVFIISVPNILALYLLAPTLKQALFDYQSRFVNNRKHR